MASTTNNNFEAQVKAIRAGLRQLAGLYETEELVERNPAGKYSIPEEKTIEDAIRFLTRVWKAEQEEATWSQSYRYRPMDGVYATQSVFKREFGAVLNPATPSFWGPIPPAFISLEVSPGEFVQVPGLGENIVIPPLPEVTFTPRAYHDEELGLLFRLEAAGKKEAAGEVQALFAMVEDELRSNSIYRGKAIDDGFRFLDLKGVDPDKIVYAEVTKGELETNVFARLRYPEALQALGVSFKGAVLLEGTYGTGKTLAAYWTGLEAELAEVTFILVRPESVSGTNGVEAFRQALTTAELYAPAVVFVEDVDTLASADQEADRISTMLDVFDGVRAKGREVMVVMTTNHVEAIHKGMVRPGRIDKIINVPAPDRAGIRKLVEVYVPNLGEIPDVTVDLGDEGVVVGWDSVTEAMVGYIPATVKAVCDNALSYMVVRLNGEVNGSLISGDDLVRSAEGYRAQTDLLDEAKDVPEGNPLARAFDYQIREAVTEVMAEYSDAMEGAFGHEGYGRVADELRR